MRWLVCTAWALGALVIGGAWAADVRSLDQGPIWGRTTATAFYEQDQGSELIPLAWIRALKQPDGKPFLADGLARYGYLANNYDKKATLPIGFVAFRAKGGQDTYLGLTCAACHTRDLAADGATWRVDGGPALADFGRFLIDLDAAMAKVAPASPAFGGFAAAVLGSGASPQQRQALADAVRHWQTAFDLLMTGVPKARPWGVGRLDAVGMIFNRVSSLDIGPSQHDYLIPANIHEAKAPARYPFLWNAPQQDFTQWPGFAPNGTTILGLARNTGEVLGVFARFHPQRADPLPMIDFLANGASMDFDGLNKLEDDIRRIGAPVWPWGIDQARASRGRELYAGKAGCANCHWLRPVRAGVTRFFDVHTWCTPIQNVGTDATELDLLSEKVDPGVLAGAFVPGVSAPLPKPANTIDVLQLAVTGSILDHVLTGFVQQPFNGAAARQLFAGDRSELRTAFRLPARAAPSRGANQCGEDPKTTPAGFESRVLFGIWAAAPYLHNGSVPTLWDLLKHPKNRPAHFAVGADYDRVHVGLAPAQHGVSSTFTATDCAAHEGDGTCGHDFGGNLTDDEKWSLIEFMKTL